jgi:hypothetical protein
VYSHTTYNTLFFTYVFNIIKDDTDTVACPAYALTLGVIVLPDPVAILITCIAFALSSRVTSGRLASVALALSTGLSLVD